MSERWQVCSVENPFVTDEPLEGLLERGWEPFAATVDNKGRTEIWLRRRTISADTV